MSGTETGITFNGIPIEYLANQDLIYLANKMKIDIDCDYNDRESILALIDNAFLRMKDREIIDPYLYIFKELNCSSYDVTVVQEEEDETSSLQTESIDIENGMVFTVKSFVVLFL